MKYFPLNIIGCLLIFSLLTGCTQYRHASYEKPKKFVCKIEKGEYYYNDDRVYDANGKTVCIIEKGEYYYNDNRVYKYEDEIIVKPIPFPFEMITL